jgi:protocatechuate 3,4-dioxygenase beta subunit
VFRALFAAALVAAVAIVAAAAENPCEKAGPATRLDPAGEPGEPLRVSGTVYRADGVTPAAGVILFAYHTDAAGYYARERGADPRLRGWMRTGKDGRYAFTTIRPGPYPNSRAPAHIHTELWGEGVPPQYGPELLFADDARVPEAERQKSAALGRFAFVLTPRKTRGTWEVDWDIRLKSTGDARLMGLAACAAAPAP